MADYFKEFIPEIWSANILAQKNNVHVFGNLSNRDYEGEIKGAGDVVRISQLGEVTINDYTRNNFATGLTMQYMDNAQLTLTIDQQKYFTIAVDKLDQVQSKPAFMSALSGKASYAIADTQDAFIAGLYTQAGLTSTSNTAAAPVALTSTSVEDECLLMAQSFDTANIQRQGRFMVIPPIAMKYLVKAGVVTKTDNTAVYENGYVGKAYGWDFYMSNNVSKGTTGNYRILCGVAKESFTMAEQIVELTNGRLQDSLKGFGDFIAGLYVYGARAIPDRTGVLYANLT